MSEQPPTEQPADNFSAPTGAGVLLLRGLVGAAVLAIVAVVIWYKTR